jgi:hypothetical protein
MENMTKMNGFDRILALDAALCANELNPEMPFSMRKAFLDLHNLMEEFIEKFYVDKSFGEFLEEQKEAVQKLAQCPEVFGAEHSAAKSNIMLHFAAV